MQLTVVTDVTHWAAADRPSPPANANATLVSSSISRSKRVFTVPVPINLRRDRSGNSTFGRVKLSD